MVCTSRIKGTKFIKKYSAWGYVNMSGEDIPYFALYVGAPKSSVLYLAEVKSITPPLESKDDLVRIRKEDATTLRSGQRVIRLKPGTLVELENPIPLVNKKSPIRALRYTTLNKFVRAKQVSDL